MTTMSAAMSGKKNASARERANLFAGEAALTSLDTIVGPRKRLSRDLSLLSCYQSLDEPIRASKKATSRQPMRSFSGFRVSSGRLVGDV